MIFCYKVVQLRTTRSTIAQVASQAATARGMYHLFELSTGGCSESFQYQSLHDDAHDQSSMPVDPAWNVELLRTLYE